MHAPGRLWSGWMRLVMRRSSVRFRQAAPAKAQVRRPFMLAGSDSWGDVDEPKSRPTGPPESPQHAIRWTSADVDGHPEAGVTSDLLSENERLESIVARRGRGRVATRCSRCPVCAGGAPWQLQTPPGPPGAPSGAQQRLHAQRRQATASIRSPGPRHSTSDWGGLRGSLGSNPGRTECLREALDPCAWSGARGRDQPFSPMIRVCADPSGHPMRQVVLSRARSMLRAAKSPVRSRVAVVRLRDSTGSW